MTADSEFATPAIQRSPWLATMRPEDQDGNADNFGVAVDNIRFQDGTEVEPARCGVTVIVGGNNVGKSTLLRQIVNRLSMDKSPGTGPRLPYLVEELSIERSGSRGDLYAWIAEHATVDASDNMSYQVIRHKHRYAMTSVVPITEGAVGPTLSGSASLFVRLSDARDRLVLCQPVQRREDFTQPATEPIHSLEDDPALFDRLEGLALDIFGQSLTLDRLGSHAFIRLGKPDVEVPRLDNVTVEYQKALEKLPKLHEQGDGIQSAMGILMSIVAKTYPIVLIDEPEVFLHPPQARFLGKALSDLAAEQRIQLIVATHDKNFLAGLVDSPTSNVTVVRLARDSTSTEVHQLEARAVRRLATDPALRYTNLLDGLFHKLVVIAENERDCQFYAAALDAASRTRPDLAVSPYDVLFLPSNGKTGMARLARHLLELGVKVVVSPDLDILNDEDTLKQLVNAFNGDWSAIERDYKLATQAFRQPRIPRRNKDVLAAVSSALNDDPEGTYSKEARRAVTSHMSVESPWKALKTYGIQAFRTELGAARRLLHALDAIGICCVEVGELEGFGPSVEIRKGPGWLAEALRTGMHETGPAKDHASRLVARLATPQDEAAQASPEADPP